MDEDKYIDQYTEFYFRIHAKVKGRTGEEPDPNTVTGILGEVGRSIRQDKITKERQEVRADKEQREDEPATDKQLALILKLGGDGATTWTKKAASKWIEEHKDW